MPRDKCSLAVAWEDPWPFCRPSCLNLYFISDGILDHPTSQSNLLPCKSKMQCETGSHRVWCHPISSLGEILRLKLGFLIYHLLIALNGFVRFSNRGAKAIKKYHYDAHHHHHEDNLMTGWGWHWHTDSDPSPARGDDPLKSASRVMPWKPLKNFCS